MSSQAVAHSDITYTAATAGPDDATAAVASGSPGTKARSTAAKTEGGKKKRKQHPLNSTWQFFINEIPEKKLDKDGQVIHDGHRIRSLGKCSTVEEFWEEFRPTAKPSNLENTEGFFLMREPFDPQWEKPEHSSGGRWRLRAERGAANYLWCELAMCAVGEKLQTLLDENNSIVGVGCSPRPSSIVIEIWTSNTDFESSDTSGFSAKLNELLPKSLYFKLVYYEKFADKAKGK
uniref:Eukaryotic translation initiation factor 4E-1 n=2 Tax=Schistocephalus solidus TaxID=70667 RepID=A0A0X3PIB4_SCHSO